MRINEWFGPSILFAEYRQFRADVLTDQIIFAALAGHDRQKSLFDF